MRLAGRQGRDPGQRRRCDRCGRNAHRPGIRQALWIRRDARPFRLRYLGASVCPRIARDVGPDAAVRRPARWSHCHAPRGLDWRRSPGPCRRCDRCLGCIIARIHDRWHRGEVTTSRWSVPQSVAGERALKFQAGRHVVGRQRPKPWCPEWSRCPRDSRYPRCLGKLALHVRPQGRTIRCINHPQASPPPPDRLPASVARQPRRSPAPPGLPDPARDGRSRCSRDWRTFAADATRRYA